MTSPLRRAVTVLVTAVLTTFAIQAPAEAAAPRQVGPPWVKASSPTSLTLTWGATSGATRYQVFWGNSYTDVTKKSARSKKTGGRQLEMRIAGLKPGRMYCFQVRALKGKKAGKKSQRHCKTTMRRANNTKLETAEIATFNVCSQAGDCYKTWDKRVASVVDSVKLANADVIGFQELDKPQGMLDDIDRALEPLGYERAEYKSSKAIYYRTSRFDVAIAPRTCTAGTRPYDGPSDTSGWDPTEPHVERGVTYTYTQGVGWTTPTEDCVEAQERTGELLLATYADKGRYAVWADLVSKKTGKVFRFVSAHLSPGDSNAATTMRYHETRRMMSGLAAADKAYPGVPKPRWIIVGDLNSHRNRSNDIPRRVLESGGWYDAYDRSATYTNPRFNSANGWSATPRTSSKYGDHIDRIFIWDQVGSTNWKVVHRFLPTGKYKGPLPSDHVPVRATLYLP